VRHRPSPTVLLIAAALLTPLLANGQAQAPRRSTDARQVGVVVWRDRLEIVFPPLPFASSTCDGSDRRAGAVLHMWNLSFARPQPHRRQFRLISHFMVAGVSLYVDSSTVLTRRQIDSAFRAVPVELEEGGGEPATRMRLLRLSMSGATWEHDQVVLTASDPSAIMDFFSSHPTEVELTWCEHERRSSQIVPVDYRYPSSPRVADASADPCDDPRRESQATWRRTANAGVIEGRVLPLANSTMPIDGALVSIAETTRATVTDSAGVFQLRDVPPGRHVLHVRRIGYVNRMERDTVTTTESSGIAGEIRLCPY